ncbi:lipoprotein [Halomonas sp. H10-59]|uniref:Lipoprotein n=1 Tax=Halomonas sp. H10-59 TaxID=2950874 RepID=A0AAU7KV32_9GAMM|nr:MULTISPECIES: lipoprotein [Halomonas]
MNRLVKVLRPALLPALLLALMALAGCGQKGPLYLPGDEEAAERYGPRETVEDEQGEEGEEDSQESDQSATEDES